MFVFEIIKYLFYNPRESVRVIITTDVTKYAAALFLVATFLLGEVLFRLVYFIPGYNLLDGGVADLESVPIEVGYLLESALLTLVTLYILYISLKFFGTKVSFKKFVVLSATLQIFTSAAILIDTSFVFFGKGEITDIISFLIGIYLFALTTIAYAALFELTWWKSLLINMGVIIFFVIIIFASVGVFEIFVY